MKSLLALSRLCVLSLSCRNQRVTIAVSHHAMSTKKNVNVIWSYF